MQSGIHEAANDVLDMAIGRRICGHLATWANLEITKVLHREVGEYAAAHGIDLVARDRPPGRKRTGERHHKTWFLLYPGTLVREQRRTFLDAIERNISLKTAMCTGQSLPWHGSEQRSLERRKIYNRTKIYR